MQPTIKVLATAMFLPVLTGFANQTLEPGALTAQPTISNLSPQSPAPTVPEVTGTEFNWRRDKNPQPLTITAPKQDITTTKRENTPGRLGPAKAISSQRMRCPDFLGCLALMTESFPVTKLRTGRRCKFDLRQQLGTFET